MNRLLLYVTVGLTSMLYIGPSFLVFGLGVALGLLAARLGAAGRFDAFSLGVIVVFAAAGVVCGLILFFWGLRSLRTALATPPSPTHTGD